MLAKIGEKEKAEMVILSSDLSPREKVGLLLEVNPERAEELGMKYREHRLLIEYLGKRKEYEKVIDIYRASDGVGYLTSYVCEAIKATGRFEVFEEILNKESPDVAFLCAVELGLGERIIELFPEAVERYMKGPLPRRTILNAIMLIEDELMLILPSIEKLVEFEVAKKNRAAYEFAAELLKLVKKADAEEYERLMEKLKKKHPRIKVLWEILERTTT